MKIDTLLLMFPLTIYTSVHVERCILNGTDVNCPFHLTRSPEVLGTSEFGVHEHTSKWGGVALTWNILSVLGFRASGVADRELYS